MINMLTTKLKYMFFLYSFTAFEQSIFQLNKSQLKTFPFPQLTINSNQPPSQNFSSQNTHLLNKIPLKKPYNIIQLIQKRGMSYDEYQNQFYDHSLDNFQTYDQYLDEHITQQDKMYLGDIQLARQLKQQGYHSKTQILTRQQFYQKKRAIEQAKLNLNKDKTKSLASTVPNRKKDPLLDLLAQRQQWVLNGRWLTIIFLRVQNPQKKIQISGYIDYAHRLKTQDFRTIFDGSIKLVPKPTDLSYYNWKTGVCASNDSPNFKVDASSGQSGLLFRNKRDRKVINVNPYIKQDQNVKRIQVISPDYTQIVLYDHQTRKKNN